MSSIAKRPESRSVIDSAGGDLAAEGAIAALPKRPQIRRMDDLGMATAEYAVATLAACGFAGLLVALLSSGEVRGMLLSIVKKALTLG